MVDVIIDGEPAYCLPDCTCCTACQIDATPEAMERIRQYIMNQQQKE